VPVRVPTPLAVYPGGNLKGFAVLNDQVNGLQDQAAESFELNLKNNRCQAMNEETKKLVDAIQEWHGQAVAQLKEIINHPSADMKVGDITIGADTEKAKGIRFGVSLSLELLGKLPLTINAIEDEDEEIDTDRLCYFCGQDGCDCDII